MRSPRRTRTIQLATLALCAALPSAAWPQAAATALSEAQTPLRLEMALRVAAAVAVQERGGLLTSAPQLAARWRARERVYFELHWGVALQTDVGVASPVFRAGNPWYLGAYHRTFATGAFALGLGVAAPVARVELGPEGRAQRSAFGHTLGAWGMWNAWLWSAGRMAITMQTRALRDLGWAELRAEGAVAAMPAVRRSEEGLAWVAQAAGELCGLGGEAPPLCLHASAVVLPRSSLDKVQLAAGLRIEPLRDRRYFGLLLINVDEPLGFGRGQRLWGLHIGRELGL